MITTEKKTKSDQMDG